jgi:hypothetical protein
MTAERRDLYFAVESGATLELAHKYVSERLETIKRNAALIEPLGVKKYIQSVTDGTVVGVEFEGKVHPDFKKPNKRGASFPKAKTEWDAKFSAQTGYDRLGFDLAEALGVPTGISYTSEGRHGCGALVGYGFSAGVGFLYLSTDGPFALYIPDVAAIVSEYEAEGKTVGDECKHFKPEFEGARPILKEEWDLAVARHKLAKAEKAVQA